jgi:hypothetical protein
VHIIKVININDYNLNDIHFVFKIHIMFPKYFLMDYIKIDKIFVIFQPFSSNDFHYRFLYYF